MACPFQFPPSFVLPNLCDITGSAFSLKQNPDQEQAKQAAIQWFKRYRVFDEKKSRRWLQYGRFDLFAGPSFPDAELSQLETCLAFFFWAFSTDDLSDEGELQCKPDEVDYGHEASRRILNDPNAPQPDYPYAAMLWDILRRIRSTSSPGTEYCRFVQAYLDWSGSQVQQASNRNVDRIPPVEEFILMRRCTIGAAMVEAMVEYSLEIDLPDYVFEDPIFVAMSQATSDIMTWPNDLCSFNKEQADGDYQNLVCVLQHAYQLDLQGAVDMLTEMIRNRVHDYVNLKKRLPSFGPEVDAELSRYHIGLENFTQGCVVWYYSSPRYFRDLQPLGKEQVLIELYPKSDIHQTDKGEEI
ncbi:terpenoid synthase [Marasmius fiardii PR-910]|nr:terpenoid synthase [Marasmius fiardii PR-910]